MDDAEDLPLRYSFDTKDLCTGWRRKLPAPIGNDNSIDVLLCYDLEGLVPTQDVVIKYNGSAVFFVCLAAPPAPTGFLSMWPLCQCTRARSPVQTHRASRGLPGSFFLAALARESTNVFCFVAFEDVCFKTKQMRHE